MGEVIPFKRRHRDLRVLIRTMITDPTVDLSDAEFIDRAALIAEFEHAVREMTETERQSILGLPSDQQTMATIRLDSVTGQLRSRFLYMINQMRGVANGGI